MNFLEGIKLQLLSSGLMIVKYTLLLAVGLVLGAIMSHITPLQAFLLTKGIDTYSFSVLLILISTAFANIMGKK